MAALLLVDNSAKASSAAAWWRSAPAGQWSSSPKSPGGTSRSRCGCRTLIWCVHAGGDKKLHWQNQHNQETSSPGLGCLSLSWSVSVEVQNSERIPVRHTCNGDDIRTEQANDGGVSQSLVAERSATGRYPDVMLRKEMRGRLATGDSYVPSTLLSSCSRSKRTPWRS